MAFEIRASKVAKRKKKFEDKLLQKVKMTPKEIDELAQTADIRIMLAEILKYILK